MEGWQELIPADMTVEQDGKQVPMREVPFVKESKELPGFIKQALDAHKEVGARVRIPGRDAKPEDIAAFHKRLTDAGLVTAPPASPSDYGIAKPASLPEGLVWNEEAAGKLADVLHKHGAPKALAQDLIALKLEMDQGQQAAMTVSAEEGTTALKKEFGDQYDALRETAGRLASQLFTPEDLAYYDRLGISNNPKFLAPLMRLSPLAQQDSSFLPEAKGSEPSAENEAAFKAEVQKLMRDPMWGKDPALVAKRDKLYADRYGTGLVEIH